MGGAGEWDCLENTGIYCPKAIRGQGSENPGGRQGISFTGRCSISERQRDNTSGGGFFS